MKGLNKLIVFVFFISLFSCALYDLDKPSSISFTIVDTSGKGIEGVSVTYTSESETRETKTGSDGRLKINFSNGGVYQFTYSKANFTSQSANLFFLSGENKNLEIILTTLSEDAFLKVENKERIVSNPGLTFGVAVNTNMNYEIETSANWIKCTKSFTGLTIQCDSNHTEYDRFSTILLHADYNLKDSIKIKQLAGPVLTAINYSGKNQTSFQNSAPFVTFSREITVTSATNAGSNIAFELSTDKKTVYLKNFKLNLFSASSINVIVKASDNTQLDFSMNIQLFVNSQTMPVHDENTTFFTKDNAYCWTYTSDMQMTKMVLKQFSTSDFKETKQILNEKFNFMTYNPYNNCLYLFNIKLIGDIYATDVKLIDANTGIQKNQFTVDYNRLSIQSIAFSENGYGLMRLDNSSLMYIDAAKNHEIGAYSANLLIKDKLHPELLFIKHIRTYSNFQIFMMYGEDSSGKDYIYSTVPGSNEISLIATSNQYQNTYTSNSGTKAVLTYSDATNLIVIDLLTKESTTVALPSSGVGNVAFIEGNNGKQYILTTKGSLISMNDFAIQNFKSYNYNYNYMHSSADGKYVIINYNGKDYLYKSEIFTDFSNYIY